MRRRLCFLACLLVARYGCGQDVPNPATAGPSLLTLARTTNSDSSATVTAEIQAGIERHIETQTTRGGGYFNLPFRGKTLRLKLVRVHTEYLASLGPQRQFACVDLADVKGDVYDVDFFLDGSADAMTVSETSVHKLNGRPYYAWDQKADGTWHRIRMARASQAHLGIRRGTDTFEFVYRATLPDLSGPGRMWVPLPASDAFQTVKVLSITAPGKHQTLEDQTHGNDVLLFELAPSDSGRRVELRFLVTRKEKAAYAAPEPVGGEFLGPERLVPEDQAFTRVAEEVVRGKKGDLVRARALYDHVIDRMRYMKFGDGWGRGDALRACSVGSGNCTDFHSYFIALARATGIPARFAIGAGIPSERDAGGIDGYHCWAEFYAEGKWWPVDISEADKYTALSTYYFGHHPANRIEFSHGRDLVVSPGPTSGPINFLAYPILEAGGQPRQAKVEFSFVRLGSKDRGPNLGPSRRDGKEGQQGASKVQAR